MKEYTITRIYKTDKDKNGNQLINKNNKPYTRMSVQVSEHGEKWISGFESQVNKGWKEGDKVEMIVKENGQYLNFEVPKPADKVDEKLEKVLNELMAIKLMVNSLVGDKKAKTERFGSVPTPEGIDYPEEDINPEDIPF